MTKLHKDLTVKNTIIKVGQQQQIRETADRPLQVYHLAFLGQILEITLTHNKLSPWEDMTFDWANALTDLGTNSSFFDLPAWVSSDFYS